MTEHPLYLLHQEKEPDGRIYRLAETGVPLESKIFRKNKNASVLQSTAEHIRKVLLLNQSYNCK
jgi:hypothetical protein